MLEIHITKDGRCVYCGAKVAVACIECGEYFRPSREGHEICKPRCHQRRYRRNKAVAKLILVLKLILKSMLARAQVTRLESDEGEIE